MSLLISSRLIWREQLVFVLGQPAAGGAGAGARVVEVGERVLAEELAEAPAQGGEVGELDGGRCRCRCAGRAG